ncbi:hypothetical protein ACJMK2_032753 [Sinanodonta woodiana]|uniref:Carboxylic ester hydrolase n=1 Tax=Sinanodonta woodiana TaxID=1069815 RepID=A0ABD3X2P4_SINWO
MHFFHLFLVSLLFMESVWTESNMTVVITTVNGDIVGYHMDLPQNNLSRLAVYNIGIFQGIPYAEPPTANLRFSHPVPKRSWKPRQLMATRPSHACPQPLWFLRQYSFGPDYNNTSEDCLYLNVYAPNIDHVATNKYPVMVWIHGGSYKYGSGSEYDGRILAMFGVVVVTMNYRLGALGFLSTDDHIAPGNYGLHDQLLALRWVQSNIAQFGGDHNRVTIFGQSAGGGSVSLHMFSPKATGLFRGIIAQSGCALSPWAIYRPPHTIGTYTNKLATRLGCRTTSSAEILTCLRNKSTEEIISTNVGAPPMISAFAPRVDDDYIKDLPENLLTKHEFLKDVHFMSGFLPQELAEDLGDTPGIDNGITADSLNDFLHDKSRRYLSQADEMENALRCVYPASGDMETNRAKLIEMESDYGYVAPHIKLTEQLTQTGVSAFLYNFSYRSENSILKGWMGVPHSAELYYEFGSPFLDSMPCPESRLSTCPVTWGKYQAWSEMDSRVSRETMSLWTDFVKSMDRNDTILISSTNKTWPRYGQNGIFITISNTLVIDQLIRTKSIEFWDSFNYLDLSVHIPNNCSKSQSVIVG